MVLPLSGSLDSLSGQPDRALRGRTQSPTASNTSSFYLQPVGRYGARPAVSFYHRMPEGAPINEETEFEGKNRIVCENADC
jgi:hypothetical protein